MNRFCRTTGVVVSCRMKTWQTALPDYPLSIINNNLKDALNTIRGTLFMPAKRRVAGGGKRHVNNHKSITTEY